MTTANGTEAAAAAAEAARAGSAPPIRSVRLDSGVVLGIRPVPPVALREAARRVPRPEVPIADIGKGRDEPNPDDPEYKAALARWEVESNQASMNVSLIMGTAIEDVPEGMHRPEDDGWIEQVEQALMIVADGPTPIHREPAAARYLDWLNYYAIRTETDTFILQRIFTTSAAVSEEDVQRMAESFRRRTVRFADLVDAAAEGRSDRDRVPPSPPGDGS